MATQMTHELFGERTVGDDQLENYLNTGWELGVEVVSDIVDGTVKTVLAEVGNDLVKAQQALEAEQSKSEPRSQLVTAVSRVIDAHSNQEV